MQCKFIRTEPRHAGTNARPPPRHVRAASPNGGFFSLGFVVAVLITGALGVGIVEGVAPESGSTPIAADVDRLQPVDRAKAEAAKTLAVSEAAANSTNDARSAGKVLR